MKHGRSFSAAVYFSTACSAALLAAGCQAPVSDAKAEESAGALSAEQALSAGYLRTPFGLVHPDCVHEVANNAPLRNARESCAHPMVRETSAARSGSNGVPDTNGWVEASWADLSSPATFMHAQFDVPPIPESQSDQVLFFFPSLEPSGGAAIIQPVLQWGTSAAGGAGYWAIASWYVDSSGNAEYSTLKRVNAGDVIDGLMEGSGCNDSGVCTWKITSEDVNTGESTILNTQAGGFSYTQAQGGVLEAYGISTCGYYPTDNAITFSSISVQSGSTTLSPDYRAQGWSVSPSCGFSVNIDSISSQTLHYSN